LQLTWKSGKAFWYQTSNFQAQSTTTPLSDGWGATFDNATDSIVLSDGSPTLSFVDPATLRLRRSIQARMARAAPDGCHDVQPFRQEFCPRRQASSECYSRKAAKACAHSKLPTGVSA